MFSWHSKAAYVSTKYLKSVPIPAQSHTSKPKKKRGGFFKGLLIVVGILFIFGLITNSTSSSGGSKKGGLTIDDSASIFEEWCNVFLIHSHTNDGRKYICRHPSNMNNRCLYFSQPPEGVDKDTFRQSCPNYHHVEHHFDVYYGRTESSYAGSSTTSSTPTTSNRENPYNMGINQVFSQIGFSNACMSARRCKHNSNGDECKYTAYERKCLPYTEYSIEGCPDKSALKSAAIEDNRSCF